MSECNSIKTTYYERNGCAIRQSKQIMKRTKFY